ncbi:SMP-30/gluconolactonase/LRE family protein [Agrobacterium sp. MS2]|uniref:SMP-30/gluconolactonase/LRE family protein n=1 Tax=Agrobacterium sp. MS2 TaxID=1345498 RepID=UPI000DBF627F|nr:SMP-30/gluconolactonase/LRE family protein [Agrobacterium sp. MS2]RAL96036.1 SMP-30/gluconolactonase/LRE family protein [Agrobacterium sp. MS2]
MSSQHELPELYHNARSELGEGPWWDDVSEELLWLDLFKGEIHRLFPNRRTTETVNVGQDIGVFVKRENGGLLAAVRDGLGFIDFATGRFELVVPVEIENGANRANDGKCDALGRFWYGTMAYDQTPGAGTLYRVDGRLNAVPMVFGTTTSNGIDWSPDNTRMYHADTGTREIKAWDFDLETGALSNESIIFKAKGDQGSPDGLTVDSMGDIWVAMWGGGAVLRLDARGTLKQTIKLPVTYVTSVMFGGKALDELFITTARLPLDSIGLQREPAAGSIFRYLPDVRGRRASVFRG